MKEEVIKYLRHVGDDVVPDGVTAWAECDESDVKDEDGYGHCPDHRDCGLCRFKYMKKRGWLSEGATNE